MKQLIGSVLTLCLLVAFVNTLPINCSSGTESVGGGNIKHFPNRSKVKPIQCKSKNCPTMKTAVDPTQTMKSFENNSINCVKKCSVGWRTTRARILSIDLSTQPTAVQAIAKQAFSSCQSKRAADCSCDTILQASSRINANVLTSFRDLLNRGCQAEIKSLDQRRNELIARQKAAELKAQQERAAAEAKRRAEQIAREQAALAKAKAEAEKKALAAKIAENIRKAKEEAARREAEIKAAKVRAVLAARRAAEIAAAAARKAAAELAAKKKRIEEAKKQKLLEEKRKAAAAALKEKKRQEEILKAKKEAIIAAAKALAEKKKLEAAAKAKAEKKKIEALKKSEAIRKAKEEAAKKKTSTFTSSRCKKKT